MLGRLMQIGPPNAVGQRSAFVKLPSTIYVPSVAVVGRWTLEVGPPMDCVIHIVLKISVQPKHADAFVKKFEDGNIGFCHRNFTLVEMHA